MTDAGFNKPPYLYDWNTIAFIGLTVIIALILWGPR